VSPAPNENAPLLTKVAGRRRLARRRCGRVPLKGDLFAPYLGIATAALVLGPGKGGTKQDRKDHMDRPTRTNPIPGPLMEPEPATQPMPLSFGRDVEHVATERTLAIPVPEVDARATLTVISGSGAGRVIALNHTDTVLGRSPTIDLSFDDAAISRVHARVSYSPEAYFLEDLGSTNGTFHGGQRITLSRLASGDRFQLGPNVVLRFAVTDQLERDLLTRLVESSTRDGLTGAFNRSFFEDRLDAEVAYAQRHGTKVAVLLIDIDHFKVVNDTHGHAAGDDVLRAVAREIGRTLRVEDVLARYGGEEFAILARAATRLDAFRMAERVKNAVAALRVPFADGAQGGVTISVGIARLLERPDAIAPADLLKLADERLYKAKAAGRNTIAMSD
jgi:two-component system cell cycle response regulator